MVVAPKETLAGNGTLWILLYGGGRQMRAVQTHDYILKGLRSHYLENKCLPAASVILYSPLSTKHKEPF